MPYTDDAMISVLKKIDTAFRTKSEMTVRIQPEGEDERICYSMAVNLKYVEPSSNGLLLFNPVGRIELNRLLEKKESLRREKQILDYSRRMCLVAWLSFISSIFYLLVAIFVAVSTLIFPVRVQLLNPNCIKAREQKNCKITNKRQDSDAQQCENKTR